MDELLPVVSKYSIDDHYASGLVCATVGISAALLQKQPTQIG